MFSVSLGRSASLVGLGSASLVSLSGSLGSLSGGFSSVFHAEGSAQSGLLLLVCILYSSLGSHLGNLSLGDCVAALLHRPLGALSSAVTSGGSLSASLGGLFAGLSSQGSTQTGLVLSGYFNSFGGSHSLELLHGLCGT